jgi:hypothetical protein
VHFCIFSLFKIGLIRFTYFCRILKEKNQHKTGNFTMAATYTKLLLFSSGGGLILDHAVGLFKGITIFQPVMNGAGGNLVAIQVSISN